MGRFVEMNMIITFMPMDTSKAHPWLQGSPLEFHIPPFFQIASINFYLVLFVELTVTERDRVTDIDIVPLVVGDLDRLSVTLGVRVNGHVVAIGLPVTEPHRVSVIEVVGVIDLVYGHVVGIADGLTVIVTERVILTDTVLDPVAEPH